MVAMNISAPGIPKGDAGTQLLEEQRHQQGSEEGTEIDDPVKTIEYFLRQLAIGLVKLIADKRGYQWFNPAGTERDQKQAGIKTIAVILEYRQTRMSGAIHQTEPEHGIVFTEVTVSEPATQQRKK
jgi:hypothetical protein